MRCSGCLLPRSVNVSEFTRSFPVSCDRYIFPAHIPYKCNSIIGAAKIFSSRASHTYTTLSDSKSPSCYNRSVPEPVSPHCVFLWRVTVIVLFLLPPQGNIQAFATHGSDMTLYASHIPRSYNSRIRKTTTMDPYGRGTQPGRHISPPHSVHFPGFCAHCYRTCLCIRFTHAFCENCTDDSHA